MTHLHSAEYAPHLYADMDIPAIHARNITILNAIERCSEPARLRQWIYNADRRGALEVRNAAFRRLALLAEKTPEDTLSNAALRCLSVYRIRLNHRRCYKVNMTKYQLLLNSDGPKALLEDLTSRRRFKEITQRLIEMDLADLTIEAVMVRFQSKFSKKTVEAAKARLRDYGFNGHF